MAKNKKLDEILKSLDSYRSREAELKLVGERLDFVKKCREHECPISYEKITKLWEEIGWGKISPDYLRRQYKKATSK